MKKAIVVTTINEKTDAVLAFEKLDPWVLYLVGDRKSRNLESTERTLFLSLETQRQLNFELATAAPVDHYCRKNIGYLIAISNGTDVIYDTDDDNIPCENWEEPAFSCSSLAGSGERFVNIYRHFTSHRIWPRGYPLDELDWERPVKINQSETANVGIWQGLADRDPDVDAIFRLIDGQEIQFERTGPVYLGAHSYCPINSQNTFWRPEVYPLLYLPATVSFRFTDILRGYVAQRICWQHGFHVGFQEATVYQVRNAHDLMKDFGDEFQCYTQVRKTADILDSLHFSHDMCENLRVSYSALADGGIVTPAELPLVEAWIRDVGLASSGRARG